MASPSSVTVSSPTAMPVAANSDTSAPIPPQPASAGASYWTDPRAGTGAGGESTRQQLQPGKADATEQATDGSIDGGGDGTRLAGSKTPDGKTIQIGQLSQDDNVSFTRERTMATNGFGGSYVSDDQFVLTTKGSKDDQVQVTQSDDGTLAVTVNDRNYHVKLAQGQQFAIRVGDGDDTVTVASNVKVNFVIEGGAGNDTLGAGAGNDHVDGGAGNDTITGGDGRDVLFGDVGNDTLDGGKGNNVVYGGDGDDRLSVSGFATGDINYFEGGEGDDTIDGSKGQNIVSGGNGDDSITSGGRNTIYAGDGKDTIDGATSSDKIYAQTSVDAIRFAAGQSDSGQVVVNVRIDPSLGTTGIKVEGSPAFRQRLEADLAMLRTSEVGQQMLAAFDTVAQDKGHTLTIREFTREVNSVTYPADPNATMNDIQIGRDGKPGPGVDTIVEYNSTIDLDSEIGKFGGFQPSVVLFHEMSHAYNMTNGNLLPGMYGGGGADGGGQVPNSERQAVGLETTATPFDFGDGSGPITHNPIALSENGLRREFGLEDRPSYAL